MAAEVNPIIEPSATGSTRARSVRKFSWEAVAPGLTRSLLQDAYLRAEMWADYDKVGRLSTEQLADQARKVFGSPPRARDINVVMDVLRQRWVPAAPKASLDRFAGIVKLGLSGADRNADLRLKSEMVDFLMRRRLTETFCAHLRAAFVSAHRVETAVPVRPGGGRGRQMGSIRLHGEGIRDCRHPYTYQSDAWSRLDLLMKAARDDDRRGLVVLPTGAGKTFTIVAWLLRRLAADESMRVLWMADQRELVDQAAREFAVQARTLPKGASRSLRAIHGTANLATALADERLDIACVTRQSVLGKSFDPSARKRLKHFLSRPCVVVVDEAHHSVAPTYQELLSFITEEGLDVALIGLTATPWPSGHGMTRLLRDTFPTSVVEVSVRDLVRDGILARPTMHTVDTCQVVTMDALELRQAASGEIPASVLRRLDQRVRNRFIVNTWIGHRDRWGKTLVFACDIEHADHLHEEFVEAGVPSIVVHSRSEVLQSEGLKEFRSSKESSVLISVGMLLEGVDVPDARTAFLARPTKSRVLMRQMIGRVLRGPSAGGEAIAHVVDLRDRWSADIDVLAPIDIPGLDSVTTATEPDGRDRQLPPIIDELSGEPISEDLVRRISRDYEAIVGSVPFAPAMSTTELIGFYELGHVNVPVFAHAVERWSELVSAAITENWRAWSAFDYFGDLPGPRPSKADITEVVEHCRSTRTEPVMIEVRVRFSVKDLARELLSGRSASEKDKIYRFMRIYDSTLARAAYPSFQAFYEAIHQEVLVQSGALPGGINPESPNVVARNGAGLPKLMRRSVRDLAPLVQRAVARGRELLRAENEEYLQLLDRENLPRVRWTDNDQRGVWAFWVAVISGRRQGQPEIRVNSVLRAPRTQVSDELLEYLLWHELCHHILPGRGHDAEFRRLEALWPDSEVWDHLLDSMSERFDLGWDKK